MMENLEVQIRLENINQNCEKQEHIDKTDDFISYTYDEAVELAGHGRYNNLLLLTCSIISNAVALDMFGFAVVVAAASCDLRFGIAETGVLVSIPFAGLLFAFPWGYYSDTRGRRKALLLSTSVGFILASLSSLSSNWQTMLVFKLVGCSFSTAAFTLTMTYLGEWTKDEYRSQYLSIMNSINLVSEAVSFILAYILLPLTFDVPIPWLTITYRPWRLLTFLMAVPLGFRALMLVFLHESSKFLANIGKTDKALIVLRSVYEINGGRQYEYPVKYITPEIGMQEQNQSFWRSLKSQTVPIFQRPLLWRTFQLFYLFIICCSTNNVFVMWFPTMVNSFFTSLSDWISDEKSFCTRIINNITSDPIPVQHTCNDTLSPNTLYSGIVYGIFFMVLNLIISKLAAWRRFVLIATFAVSAISCILVNLLRVPIASMVFFTLLQGTSVGIGITASYFVDLFPTSYGSLATSLGMVAAQLASFVGVNLVRAVIVDHCSLTFYGWSIFVLSGVGVTWFLPPDKQSNK